MIIDSHCHAWHSWPYDPAIADPHQGAPDRLIEQFDSAGVDHGLLIAARIGADHSRTDNRDNNEYLAEVVQAHAGRLSLCVEVDSFWDPLHHTDGAAERLDAAIAATGAIGVTHYSTGPYDGWFDSTAGMRFFDRAAELGLITSLHTPPNWQPAIGRIAARLPDLPILIHHQGHVPTQDGRYAEESRLLLANACHRNLMIKVSGFYYLTTDQLAYPYIQVQNRLQRLYEAFGADRLLWGSDWPVAGQFLSYRQTFELVATEIEFLTDMERQLVLGDNLAQLLGLAQRPG